MPGQIVHIEIPADDTAKSREFWGSLFGWQFESFPAGSEYHTWFVTCTDPHGNEFGLWQTDELRRCPLRRRHACRRDSLVGNVDEPLPTHRRVPPGARDALTRTVRQTRPSSVPTRAKISSADSSWLVSKAADICTRTRAVPSETTG